MNKDDQTLICDNELRSDQRYLVRLMNSHVSCLSTKDLPMNDTRFAHTI